MGSIADEFELLGSSRLGGFRGLREVSPHEGVQCVIGTCCFFAPFMHLRANLYDASSHVGDSCRLGAVQGGRATVSEHLSKHQTQDVAE